MTKKKAAKLHRKITRKIFEALEAANHFQVDYVDDENAVFCFFDPTRKGPDIIAKLTINF
jgi:hypothetical protein